MDCFEAKPDVSCYIAKNWIVGRGNHDYERLSSVFIPDHISAGIGDKSCVDEPRVNLWDHDFDCSAERIS